ncbi:hypothetical protein F4781DRAFT_319597 [Annulohypoxylon bovei var. microspora]|nr:hypothetical protein F4781DRAFT_319597 [Annulohypoxylon bovei var. microspora]
MPPRKSRSFRLFPRLPPELRHMIWREALCVEGDNQYIRVGNHSMPSSSVFDTLNPSRDIASLIIRVCRESRVLAKAFYPTVLSVYSTRQREDFRGRMKKRLKGCVRVNLERATLVSFVAQYNRLPPPPVRFQTNVLTNQQLGLVRNLSHFNFHSVFTSIVPRSCTLPPQYPNLESYRLIRSKRHASDKTIAKVPLCELERYVLDNVQPKTRGWEQLYELQGPKGWAGQVRNLYGGYIITTTKSSTPSVQPSN